MNRKKIRLTVIPVAALLLAALMPGATLAAPEHRITLELEGGGSALTTVSAQSCDAGTLAEELTARLVDKGLDASYVPDGDQESRSSVFLNNFTGRRQRMILEPGSDCEGKILQARIVAVELSFFGADTSRLVEVEIEIGF